MNKWSKYELFKNHFLAKNIFLNKNGNSEQKWTQTQSEMTQSWVPNVTSIRFWKVTDLKIIFRRILFRLFLILFSFKLCFWGYKTKTIFFQKTRMISFFVHRRSKPKQNFIKLIEPKTTVGQSVYICID